ncbi:MAG: OadG family protein [Clostridium sp.]|nr:OadG family protein [Clostridium sp.]
MNKRIIGALAGLLVVAGLSAQGSRNLKITEVVTNNTEGLTDACGRRSAWIEITNTSWSTVDVRSCYLTTNRGTLNEQLSVPERVRLMSVVPKGDEKTSLAAQERIVFFADGQTNLGTLHTAFTLNPGEETFIALFDGNGSTLIDSLTVPPLAENQSYARIFTDEDGVSKWIVLDASDVTPGYANRGQEVTKDKVAEFKEKDPYGVAMAFMAMSIVFGCLIFLYIFFRIFGWFMDRMAKLARVKAIRKIRESASKVAVIAKDGMESRGVDMETYMAVIGMALHEYENDVHDVESNVLTLHTEEHTDWTAKDNAMRDWPK